MGPTEKGHLFIIIIIIILDAGYKKAKSGINLDDEDSSWKKSFEGNGRIFSRQKKRRPFSEEVEHRSWKKRKNKIVLGKLFPEKKDGATEDGRRKRIQFSEENRSKETDGLSLLIYSSITC